MRATCVDFRRLRPVLGTFVEISVAGAAAAGMERAVEAAFAAVATVHRLMSFHEETSDVSRLNRCAAEAATPVHPWTFQVLEAALDLYRRSNGLFDIRVAPALQKRGLLPFHKRDPARRKWSVTESVAGDSHLIPGLGFCTASSQGEIELLHGHRVRFAGRATRIDLGGIAKGFAVDRAIGVLRDFGMPLGLVNAGGDIAAFGPRGHAVSIRDPAHPGRTLCQIELCGAAIASSGPRFDPVESTECSLPGVIDPASGEPACRVIAATVKAPSCLWADALTKVVMIAGRSSMPVLRQFDASALFVSAEGEIYVTPEWSDVVVAA